MPRVIYLDSGPLGLACHPNARPGSEATKFQLWLRAALLKRTRVIVPAIADYEVRRELVRSGLSEALAKLDLIEAGQHPDLPGIAYLPLTADAIKRAAVLWARARDQGQATASDAALDGDVLIAAQALDHAGPASRFQVATSNVRDLNRYVGWRARHWTLLNP